MTELPEIFAYPTESFYGLGVRATSRTAVRKLFLMKQREGRKPIALVAADLQQVKKFFYLSRVEEQIALQHWPGSLTILLRPKPAIAARELGAKKIGVRIPAHVGARRLAKIIGEPITATSANVYQQPPTKSPRKVKKDFPGILIVPGNCGRQRLPSTIIKVSKKNITIIRQGPVHV